MTDIIDQAAPVADPTYAELLTRDALRTAAWAGGNMGERKLVLLRLCDHASAAGVVTIDLPSFAAEVQLSKVHLKRLIHKLVHRGDLTQLARHPRFNVRSYQLSPRL